MTGDAPRLLALKTLIDSMGEAVYGRSEKLLTFMSSPVVSMIIAPLLTSAEKQRAIDIPKNVIQDED